MNVLTTIITALSALVSALGACLAGLHIRRSSCCGSKCSCNPDVEQEIERSED